MRIINRRIRGLFALQAILLLVPVISSLINPRYAVYSGSPLRHYAFFAGDLVLSVVFAMAWWTTRKPSAFRNLWAIAASLASLGGGLFILWLRHSNLTIATPGLILVAIGVVGILLHAQGGAQPRSATGTSPAPVIAATKRASVAGDRTSPWFNRAFTVLSIAAQFASIFLWSIWARSHGLLQRGYLPWFVLFTLAVLASTTLHECGHAFVAWTFKMKLLSFNAGPFQWRKREGNWKFKFDMAGFDNLGGAASAVPTDPKQSRTHDLFMLAAGPLANILFGALALCLVLRGHWPLYEQTWRLVAYTASFSFIAAVTNLLPFMTEDGGYSDGARVLQILTNSPLNDDYRGIDILAPTLVV